MAEELVMDDCGSDDYISNSADDVQPVTYSASERVPEGETVGPALAGAIHKLLLGSQRRALPRSFAEQGFFFHETIPYGLVQNEGGCCGVLAVVQAYIVKYMFYDCKRKGDVTVEYQQDILAESMAALLSWIMVVNKRDRMVVCLSPQYGEGTNISAFRQYFHTDVTQAKKCILGSIQEFSARRGAGLLQFMVSCILTRGGVEECRQDMDMRECSLIVTHDYCSQELVNFLLTGKCMSNVFDGKINLGSEMLLKGIDNKCNVGMLTLYEHYGSMTVGDNLKNPCYPIWVICSESHYTVLFSDRRQPEISLPGARFTLKYYDQLARQEQEILLHVDLSEGLGNDEVRKRYPDELVPPVDDCIRTKWPGAVVTWEGSDPIL